MAKKEFSPSLLAAQADKLATIGFSKDSVNVEELDATIEVLRQLKNANKEAIKAQAQAERDANKAEAVAAGRALVEKAKKGDIATVICGSGKFAKEYKFPIVKIGENTITVEYTESNTPNGTVGPRYINFGKVVKIDHIPHYVE